MGFDLVTGVVVILAAAFVLLALLLIGRRAVKEPTPNEGVNASTNLRPHKSGRVGRVEESDAPNRKTAV